MPNELNARYFATASAILRPQRAPHPSRGQPKYRIADFYQFMCFFLELVPSSTPGLGLQYRPFRLKIKQ
jgi:hypothetical protein